MKRSHGRMEGGVLGTSVTPWPQMLWSTVLLDALHRHWYALVFAIFSDL